MINGGGYRTAIKPLRVRPLVWIAASWAAGAACGAALCGTDMLLWLIPCALCLAYALLRRRTLALCAAVLFLSAAVTGFSARRPEAYSYDEKVTVSGTVCSDMRVYGDYAVTTLRDVTIDGSAHGHNMRLYIYPEDDGGIFPDIIYGDRLTFDGMPRTPAGKTGFGDYDSAATMWRAGVDMTVYADVPEIITEEGAWSPLRAVYTLRAVISDRLDRLFGDSAPVARALLIGDKTALSDEEYTLFRGAGIVHLLAVSGLHIGILAKALYWVLQKIFRLSRKAAFCVILPVLALYAALTGFPASIIRAGLCFALMHYAPLDGRPYDGLTGLAAAYLIICLCRPLMTFDPGLILSFSAMLGIMLISPVFMDIIRRPAGKKSVIMRTVMWVYDTVCCSAGAALGTLPAVACMYGGVSLWSLAVNIFVMPLMTFIMPLLAVSAGAGTGGPVTEVCSVLIEALRMIPEQVSKTGAPMYVRLAYMKAPFIIAYILAAIAMSPYIKALSGRARRAIKPTLVFVLIGISALNTYVVTLSARTETDLRITFYDVGQGDSALINAQGSMYLIDTGRGHTSSPRLNASAVALEGLFLTHPDDDHTGDLADVIAASEPTVIYLPAQWELAEVPEGTAKALEGRNIVYLKAGDTLALSEDIICEVLHPGSDEPSGDNDVSLVLRIVYGKGSALFMGDLADRDIDFEVPDCDIIKLAHHGSGSSSGKYMLMCASPSAAVISVGQNRYGHPDAGVLESLDDIGAAVLRTDERGDITVLMLTDGAISVSQWLEE